MKCHFKRLKRPSLVLKGTAPGSRNDVKDVEPTCGAEGQPNRT
jgi:hypothetical protein